MTSVRFDLQSHSTRSDGALEPGAVVAAAAASGVELLALTDHDTVDGVDEALAAAAQLGTIGVVPAIELSSVDDAGEDLHVLGYGIDHRDPGFLATLGTFRADRVARIGRMADALEALGYAVDREHLRRDAPGRPHLAQAVTTHPANAARLRDEGLEEFGAFLVAYLIPGRPAYRRRSVPSVPDAIAAIHAAGGVAVWAHPFWDVDDPAVVADALRRFRADGLDGVEAYYPTHDAEQARFLHRQAEELDLLTTGSTDFHGPGHRLFADFLGFELHGCAPRLGPIAAARR